MEKLSLENILRNYVFGKIRAKIINGDFIGYIIDIDLPIENDIVLYFVEEHKAKRYLAKFNPSWKMRIPLEFISDIELIEFDEISERLMNRRLNMYYPE